jgi:hypothetical protein
MNPYQSALASSAPSSNFPIGNESAKNNQQRAKGIVDQQSEALARVNEIRGLWSSSMSSEQLQEALKIGATPKLKDRPLVNPGDPGAPNIYQNPPPIMGGGMKTMWNKETESYEFIPAFPGSRVFAGTYYDTDRETGELKSEAYYISKNANENVKNFVETEGRFPTAEEFQRMNPNVGKTVGGGGFTPKQSAKYQDATNILKTAGWHRETELERSQKQWEENPMRTGVGPLGGYGSYAEARKPNQEIIDKILKERKKRRSERDEE